MLKRSVVDARTDVFNSHFKKRNSVYDNNQNFPRSEFIHVYNI